MTDEKSQKDILIFDILYENLIGAKPLRIRFDKIDGFIRSYDGTRYLRLFGSEKFDAIYNRIGYLTSLKNSITYVFFFHYYAKIKVDSYDSLLIEQIFALHNVIIPIKSVLNKDQNQYYYNKFLEKCTYQLAKKQSQISFDIIVMLRFGEIKVTKEKFHGAKSQYIFEMLMLII